MPTTRSARSRALPMVSGFLNQLPQLDAAACSREDPELFFPERYRETLRDKKAVTKAKRVCSRCPSAIGCLVAALTGEEAEGIWGGYTPAERRRVSKDIIAVRRPVDALVDRLTEGRRFPVSGADLVAVVRRLSKRGWSVERNCAATGAQSETVLQARLRGNQAVWAAAAVEAHATRSLSVA